MVRYLYGWQPESGQKKRIDTPEPLPRKGLDHTTCIYKRRTRQVLPVVYVCKCMVSQDRRHAYAIYHTVHRLKTEEPPVVLCACMCLLHAYAHAFELRIHDA